MDKIDRRCASSVSWKSNRSLRVNSWSDCNEKSYTEFITLLTQQLPKSFSDVFTGGLHTDCF